MNKKLILAFVLVPLAFVTLVLVISYKNRTSQKSAVLANQTAASTPGNPKLEIYDYNVFLQYPTSNEWIAGKDKEEVLPGTKIKTDNNGVAQLIYPNGTVTRLGNDTQITLSTYEASPQKVSVFVEAGTIWSRITKLLGGESYESESKNLVATVRGTVYEHTVLATGEDKVSVDSHVVHVNCLKTKVETDVTEDQQTQTSCATVPVAVVTPIKEKQTKWVTFNKEEDKKLRTRFKNAKYDEDEEKDKETPTPTPTATSSTLGVSTTKPTTTPTPTSTPTVTPTPTPTPLPLSVTGVSIVCVPRQTRYSSSVCQDGSTQIELKGTGFTDGIKVFAIPTQYTASPTPIASDTSGDWPSIKSSSDMIARFTTALQGTYYVRITLNNQIIDTNASFTIY
ncbi:MAG TPA: FecR domain-containing protein [Patescibacteria group bacterium]